MLLYLPCVPAVLVKQVLSLLSVCLSAEKLARNCFNSIGMSLVKVRSNWNLKVIGLGSRSRYQKAAALGSLLPRDKQF